MSKKSKVSKQQEQSKNFRITVKVAGSYSARFEFQDEGEVLEWLQDDFQSLKQRYGNLLIRVSGLPSLKIGQTCHVFGEGRDVFKITGISSFFPNSNSFILDGSETESVSNCFVLDKDDEYVKYKIYKSILNKTAIMKCGVMDCDVE